MLVVASALSLVDLPLGTQRQRCTKCAASFLMLALRSSNVFYPPIRKHSAATSRHLNRQGYSVESARRRDSRYVILVFFTLITPFDHLEVVDAVTLCECLLAVTSCFGLLEARLIGLTFRHYSGVGLNFLIRLYFCRSS